MPSNSELDAKRDEELSKLAIEYAYESETYNHDNWKRFREAVFATITKYGAGKDYTKEVTIASSTDNSGKGN